MSNFKEGTFVPEEGNVREKINRAAREVGLPPLDELSRPEDVEALAQLLKETGAYQEPSIPDEITLGRERLKEIKRYALEKDPVEIHYQVEAIKAVQDVFERRFNLSVPKFPTDRILLIPPEDFDDLYPSLFAATSRRGLYDNENKIVVVAKETDKADNLSKRIHIATHELTHAAFHSQPTYNMSFGISQRALNEGITEQVALEISIQLLTTPDLIEETRHLLRSSPKDEIMEQIPFMSRTVRNPASAAYFVHYAYPLERCLLEYLAATFHKLPADKKDGLFNDEDPLKTFVEWASGKDPAKLRRLTKSVFGKQGLRLLFEEAHRPLDTIGKLKEAMEELTAKKAE